MQSPALPQELQTELNRVNEGVGRYISKIFTYILTPLLLPLATAFAYGVQKWCGINLDPAELTGYLTAVASGVGITAFKWVSNRGEWERSVVEVAQWYRLGQQAHAANLPAPSPPSARG
jgi:hypothetical protein